MAKRTDDVREGYDVTIKAARNGTCGFAIRLYGIANERVGRMIGSEKGVGPRVAAQDRKAWDAIMSCFTKGTAR